jgi:hypothetical protein
MGENKASKATQQAKVVKVSPYPIPCSLKKGDSSEIIKGDIARLELIGFVIKTTSKYFKTGDRYTCEFEIPATHKKVIEEVRVIKTYEAATGTAERPVMVEFHFSNKVPKEEDSIRKFLARIGQKSL